MTRSLRPREGAHRATTAHLQAAYPFMAGATLGGRGVYVGRDLHGGSFCYDPFALYGTSLYGPNLLVAGLVGSAKSSWVKTYLYRGQVFGRHAWVIDPKGEYTKLAAALGATPIRLAPGSGLTLNPLDPIIGIDGQAELLAAVAAAALGRPLTPTEDTALEFAHTAALTQAASQGRAEATLPMVVHALLHPSQQAAIQAAMTAAELADGSRDLALRLRRLCAAPELAGMLDGPTSSTIDLQAPLVVVDLSGTSQQVLPIVMLCATAWLEGLWRHGDGAKRVVVLDEAWLVLRHLPIARWLRAKWKLARNYGVQMVAVLHRLSDLAAAGDADSEQVALAKGLLEDSETRVLYRQPPGELDTLRALVGLSDEEAELVTMLDRGEALWFVGQRSFLVQHRLSDDERALVDTDAQMAERPSGSGGSGC